MEKQIEKRLRLGVKKLGGIAYKWVSPGNPGVYDRLICLPENRIFIVECKADTSKKLDPFQIIFKQKMESLQIPVYEVYCNADVDLWLFKAENRLL